MCDRRSSADFTRVELLLSMAVPVRLVAGVNGISKTTTAERWEAVLDAPGAAVTLGVRRPVLSQIHLHQRTPYLNTPLLS